ncbi:MAG: hypothetical protein COS89_04655 [Deltaproteobacteria bacterium CG07_land_8_20_14_0_80_38_7]|nr:MAG: hypothetical protein COS89_04655 [Deltaproteobacteria bacterium CG07_land_8_20_14_0_80_38_7]
MLFTNNQLDILNIFFSRPDLEIHMNELGRILEKQPGVFQKGLNQLEQMGVLSSKRRGNQRLFSLNKNYSILKEIKSIVEKTSGLIPQLTQIISEFKEIRLAFLFGSFVQNKMRPDSDIDLMIVCSSSIQEKILRKLSIIEEKFLREINPKFITPRTFAEKRNKKDPFICEVLNGKLMLLKGQL